MSPRQSIGRVAPTWRSVNVTAMDVLVAVSLLLGTVSFLAMASGDPELVALVALTGLAVVLLGTFLVRSSERLRTSQRFTP